MSIIAIKNVPYKWGIHEIMNKLAVGIKGPFEVLNFEGKKNQPTKICYVRLSARLDPVRIVEDLNTHTYPKFVKLFAYIPENIPDLPLAKKRAIPRRYRQSLELPELLEPYQVAVLVHQEILIEMQAKFPELYNLSLKTGNHKLLNEISRVIFERIKTIIDNNDEVAENCFRMSQFYRKMHPHFGDFQLILSTLHKLQDASGAPRMQLNENDLAKFEPKSYTIGNVAYPKVQKYCSAYNNKIYESIKKHVSSWDMKTDDKDEESVARNKIRYEITKIMPYMPTILHQLTTRHLIPEELPHHRVRIYGEPFMPNKNLMQPFLKKFTGNTHIIRSNRMYNLIRFKLPQKSFLALLAMDGTVMHGSKLIIRNEMPTYSPPKYLKNEMLMAMDAPVDTAVEFADEADVEDQQNSEDNDDDDEEEDGEGGD